MANRQTNVKERTMTYSTLQAQMPAIHAQTPSPPEMPPDMPPEMPPGMPADMPPGTAPPEIIDPALPDEHSPVGDPLPPEGNAHPLSVRLAFLSRLRTSVFLAPTSAQRLSLGLALQSSRWSSLCLQRLNRPFGLSADRQRFSHTGELRAT